MLVFNLLFVFSIQILYTSAQEELEKNASGVEETEKLPFQFPEQLGPYYQGDILIANKRNGIINKDYRWPNNTVPFVVEGNFPQWGRATINRAMVFIMQKTCIKFRPKTNENKDYIRITSRHNGCYSYVGRIGGPQVVNLASPGCVYYVGTVIHELMHAIGFEHEQSRSDRDKYVEILFDKVDPRYRYNFDKYNESYITHYGVPYDYDSVMHYPNNAFGLTQDTVTIVAKNGQKNLGQRHTLTDLDAKKINAMYNCTK